MMSSDMLTIGSALRMAENAEKYADVLIEGQWVLGRVEAVEGDSAILTDDSGDQIILRLASISAVRVRNTAPTTPTAAGAGTGVNIPEEARTAAALSRVSNGGALDAVLAQRKAAEAQAEAQVEAPAPPAEPTPYVGRRVAGAAPPS